MKKIVQLAKSFKSFQSKHINDKGVGTVEIILICVVLIGLVLIFKDQIGELINSLFSTMGDKTAEIIS